MNISRVFLPQDVRKYDHVKRELVPVFDFSAAAQFGELTTVLDLDDDPLFLARITPKIRKALESFSESDYFLAVGDPAVIATCSGIILRRLQTMKMLRWDRKLKMYINLEIRP